MSPGAGLSCRGRGLLRFAAGLAVGVGLFLLWLRYTGGLGPLPRHTRPALLLAALVALWGVLGLYTLRTGLVLRLSPRRTLRRLPRPVLLAHAVSVLGVPLAGGLAEVFLLAGAVGRSKRMVLPALLFRMSLNLAAVGLLAAVALFGKAPGVALVLGGGMALLPFAFQPIVALARRIRRLRALAHLDRPEGVRPFGLLPTAGLLLLSLVECSLAAAALLLVGRALAVPLTPPLALGAFALAEVATYSPVPLGAIGLHHWGIVGAVAFLAPDLAPPALLAVVHHALLLLMGALSGGVALLLPSRSHPPAR